jgi:hypothetical protein
LRPYNAIYFYTNASEGPNDQVSVLVSALRAEILVNG